MASSDSTAPFGEPGRFTISVRPRVPATARDNGARCVCLRPSDAHHFGQAGNLTLDRRASRFRRNITSRHASAAGRQNDLGTFVICRILEQLRDLLGIVSHQFAANYRPAECPPRDPPPRAPNGPRVCPPRPNRSR